MDKVDSILIQLQKDMTDGFTGLQKDMTNELNAIKKDIAQINTELAEIKVKMSTVNKQIYGNGKKGLVDRVDTIENVVSSGGLIWRTVINFIAWIIATGIAIYAAINK